MGAVQELGASPPALAWTVLLSGGPRKGQRAPGTGQGLQARERQVGGSARGRGRAEGQGQEAAAGPLAPGTWTEPGTAWKVPLAAKTPETDPRTPGARGPRPAEDREEEGGPGGLRTTRPRRRTGPRVGAGPARGRGPRPEAGRDGRWRRPEAGGRGPERRTTRGAAGRHRVRTGAPRAAGEPARKAGRAPGAEGRTPPAAPEADTSSAPAASAKKRPEVGVQPGWLRGDPALRGPLLPGPPPASGTSRPVPPAPIWGHLLPTRRQPGAGGIRAKGPRGTPPPPAPSICPDTRCPKPRAVRSDSRCGSPGLGVARLCDSGALHPPCTPGALR